MSDLCWCKVRCWWGAHSGSSISRPPQLSPLCKGSSPPVAAAAAVHTLGCHLHLAHPGRLSRTGTWRRRGRVRKEGIEGGHLGDFLAAQKRRRCILPTRAGLDSYRGPTWDRLASQVGKITSWYISKCKTTLKNFASLVAEVLRLVNNCETQPPASIGWVALSSMFVRSLSRIRYTSSYLHYMMFQTIQTIYFLWGYDPGNMSVSTYPLYSLLSWAQFTVV